VAKSSHARKPDDVGAICRASATSSVAAASDSPCLDVGGDREDELIPNDGTKIHLKQDEHFYSQRDFVIIVNGQKKTITAKTVTFDEIVKLAFPTPPSGANILHTVSYEDGPKVNPQGSLIRMATKPVSVREKRFVDHEWILLSNRDRFCRGRNDSSIEESRDGRIPTSSL
jgi:hypothetical protein